MMQGAWSRTYHLIVLAARAAMGLLLLLGLVGFLLTARKAVGSQTYVAHNHQPLAITAAVGSPLTLGIRIEQGVEDYWASPDGLVLKLGRPLPQGLVSEFLASRAELVVVAPKAKRWGKSVSVPIDAGTGSSITTTFRLPATLDSYAPTTLDATLSGILIYLSGGRVLSEQTLAVQVPVRVHLVTAGALFSVTGRARLYQIFWGEQAFALLFVLFLGQPLWKNARALPRAWRERGFLPLARWFGRSCLLGLLCFLLLWVLLNQFSLTGGLFSPEKAEEIHTLSLSMSGSLGFVTMIVLLARATEKDLTATNISPPVFLKD